MALRIIESGARISGIKTSGTEYIIPTENLETLSVHAVYTVAGITAKTFISGTKATKVIQDITYTAVSGYSPTDNTITITYTAGATAGAEVVSVVGTAVTVQIATGVSTATQVKAAWDAHAPALALATAAITGTAGTAQVAVAVQTFAGGTGQVDIANNLVQSSAHGFVTGRKFALTTGGVLPTGLSATTYYAIRVDADTLKFATSLANAEAGGAVDITAIGTGTHTMTPAAIAGGNIKLQESSAYHPVDNPTGSFVDISGSTAAITATSESIFKPDVRCAYVKIKFDLTDGQVDINAYTCGKAYS